MQKSTNVDVYLASVPDAARDTLEGLRRTVRAVAPDAVELIGYGMPGYKYKGRPLVYYAALKNHCALYGLPADLHADELAANDVDLGDKGTIRFPPGAPPPEGLVRALLTDRMAAIDADEAKRKSKKSGAG
jgi:uncharacterized protein YdhG (YjbR/CyaY superfamily)